MKITKIQKLKEKYKISLDTKKIIYIFPSVFEDFNLYINKEISNNGIDLIKKENGKNKYFLLGLSKLNKSYCSPKKLKDYLYKKGANNEEITFVLNKLTKLNYLNEDILIEDILEYADTKHLGYNKIISLATTKCVSNEGMKKITYSKERETKEANLLCKELRNRIKNKNTFLLRKSICSSLVSHGFNMSVALEASNKVFNSNEIELNVLKLDYLKAKKKYSDNSKVMQYLLQKGYKYDDIISLKETHKYEMD